MLPAVGSCVDGAEVSPALVGILNVTPDSFSDGGQFLAARSALRKGLELSDAGAWAVDVGGESTRPGATPVDQGVEAGRILPVIRELAAAGVVVSVDTMKSSVAKAAVAAGARIINDVSGGRFDPAMHSVVADWGGTYVLSHWRGPSARMDHLAQYQDVVVEVCDELEERVALACAAGVRSDQIVVDPGIGFSKHSRHNWALLRSLPEVRSRLGFPVMVGTSRKRFLGELVNDSTPTQSRDDLTATTSALAAIAGADYLRVHDIVATRRAVQVAQAWVCGND